MVERCPDHPRRCGENREELVRQPLKYGSPPQVRGKPFVAVFRFTGERITPAGAGKTFTFEPIVYTAEDHPRRCGENIVQRHGIRRSAASPPQVRGKHCDAANCPEDCRITPAGAGKTLPTHTTRTYTQDHPRRCGENQMALQGAPLQAGITPAGAGKTHA